MSEFDANVYEHDIPSGTRLYFGQSAKLKRKIERTASEILEKNGTNKIVIERRIFRDGDNLERIIDERGQYAKTAVKVLKTYPEKNVTLVECELFTGRTHQIRVHLKSIGHTIVGDELYGNGLNKELGINRQFLHAYKVKFTHPASKEEVELEIPIFTDMKDFLEK